MNRLFRSLFGWLLPSTKSAVDDDDIHFMSAADAAIYRTGHRFAYLLSLAVGLLILTFIFWASQAVLDEVTRGIGQVIPSQRVQVIQNLEGGILEEVLVQENQIVDKNDILVRISNTAAASQYRDAASQALEQEAAIARLTAEARGKKPGFPDSLAASPLILQAQKDIYKARQQQLRSELNIIQSQYDQRRQEVAEMESRRKQLEQNLKLAQKQMNIARPLRDQGLYPMVDYLGLERDVVTLQGDIDALKLGIPRALKAAEEAKRRSNQRKAEFHAAALDELNRRRIELKSLREAISAGQDRVTRTDVRSPVRGTIKQININTIGGVIQPGQSILEVVPLDGTLLIEARIRPADIAFLHPGQPAMIKVTAYDFSIYGGLQGFVEQISADTILDEKGESHYKVKLRTKTNSLSYRGANLPIIPGMMASIDILTGEKTVLDYLLKPILKAKQNALRER